MVRVTASGPLTGGEWWNGEFPKPHYCHRVPVEDISHAVWPYHAFNLGLRDVELLLAERCVVVSYETGSALMHEIRLT